MTTPLNADFRRAMRAFVGNCSVLTVGRGAERTGIVVTSATSLAADPPMVLACVNRASSAHALFARFGAFGLNSLGAQHQTVAERFSGMTGVTGPERYAGAEWVTMESGAMLLANAPAAFDCEVDEMIDRATHSIVIGRVRAIRTTEGAGALAYWNGTYLPMPA